MCNSAFAKTPEMLVWFFQSLECLGFHVWPEGLHKLMYISYQCSDFTGLHHKVMLSFMMRCFTGYVCQLYSPPDWGGDQPWD